MTTHDPHDSVSIRRSMHAITSIDDFRAAMVDKDPRMKAFCGVTYVEGRLQCHDHAAAVACRDMMDQPRVRKQIDRMIRHWESARDQRMSEHDSVPDQCSPAANPVLEDRARPFVIDICGLRT
jgi:hypothetical protein